MTSNVTRSNQVPSPSELPGYSAKERTKFDSRENILCFPLSGTGSTNKLIKTGTKAKGIELRTRPVRKSGSLVMRIKRQTKNSPAPVHTQAAGESDVSQNIILNDQAGLTLQLPDQTAHEGSQDKTTLVSEFIKYVPHDELDDKTKLFESEFFVPTCKIEDAVINQPKQYTLAENKDSEMNEPKAADMEGPTDSYLSINNTKGVTESPSWKNCGPIGNKSKFGRKSAKKTTTCNECGKTFCSPSNLRGNYLYELYY